MQQHDKSRTYRKLRQVTNDSRKKSIMFYNEIFEQTKILRLPNETSTHRDWRALCELARWYTHHLHNKKKIIVLSELEHNEDDTPSDIIFMTTKQYLDTYWKDNALLQNLVQVLADAVLEDLDDGKIRIVSKQSNGGSLLSSNNTTAVNGYTEVHSCLYNAS